MSETKQWDTLWINGTIATMVAGAEPYGLLQHGAIAIKDGKIAWIGLASEVAVHADELAEDVYDLEGRCVTPGLIDCHTHLVYAGNRFNEFEMRMQGASYAENIRRMPSFYCA